jgi:phosphate starvation-inducible membrane PsiE
VLFKAGDQVPVIPLLEVVGKADNVPPEHIGATAVNVGVTFGFTTICNVVVVAHNPAVGVKVYAVVAVLFKAGDQVPVMPLLEVVGKADNVPPEHIGAIAVNVGVTFGFTTICNVVVVAHNPAVGVNVYVVVAVLFKAGDHVPVIPLLEVVGKADNVPPEHIGATAVKVGVIFGFTTICNVVVVAHNPAVGVKVYVVVAVLFKAGDQVPVIPLVEVVGKADNVPPEHIGATAVNVGVTIGFTVTAIDLGAVYVTAKVGALAPPPYPKKLYIDDPAPLNNPIAI